MLFLALFMCISINTCAAVSVNEHEAVFSPQSKAELEDAVDACLEILPEGDSEQFTRSTTTTTTTNLLEEYVKKFPPADPGVVKILNQELDALGLSSASMQEAARSSIERPSDGFDEQFGRSAIKTYRAFVYPKKKANASSNAAGALRCAHQVDCLVKRHKSNEAAGIRDADSLKNAANTVRNPLILLLDNLRSAFNVGSLFRTADACACKELVTTGITPHPGGGGSEKVIE